MGLRGVLILGWAGTFGSSQTCSTYAFILSQTLFAVGEGGFRKHTTPTTPVASAQTASRSKSDCDGKGMMMPLIHIFDQKMPLPFVLLLSRTLINSSSRSSNSTDQPCELLFRGWR